MRLTLDEVIEQVKQWVDTNASYNHIWLLRDYKDDVLPIKVRDVLFLHNQHTIVAFFYKDENEDNVFIVMRYEDSTWFVDKYVDPPLD